MVTRKRSCGAGPEPLPEPYPATRIHSVSPGADEPPIGKEPMYRKPVPRVNLEDGLDEVLQSEER